MPRKGSLPYVNQYQDRHGVMRYYLRRAGRPSVPLPGRPGTRKFLAAYAAAMKETPEKGPDLSHIARGQIYYVADGEYIKIGFTLNWDNRKKDYNTHSPRDVILLGMHPGSRQDEQSLHEKFGADRVRGEWFWRSPELLSHIKETTREHRAA